VCVPRSQTRKKNLNLASRDSSALSCLLYHKLNIGARIIGISLASDTIRICVNRVRDARGTCKSLLLHFST
jgi:hypothetical protein